ncbi:hypothetical protein HMPREF1863_01426 [Aedoeadaptatus coxii]|uniref:Uncharacterized protein n=1 Tax=Aedoeadaptatus coxii TaxID=755172 RepID=A0A134ACR9_9FIRM|nr:hypothetical protein HMPREF1863_01426 [Peptoniphilus coxii]
MAVFVNSRPIPFVNNHSCIMDRKTSFFLSFSRYFPMIPLDFNLSPTP